MYPASFINAIFDTAPAGQPAASGWVERRAELIFKAGRYPFSAEQGGDFEMTPEDIYAFCREQEVKDVICELEDTHHPSVFNGKIGHLSRVVPSADYSQFGGVVRIPKWFDDLFPGQPIKLSANWKRDPANPRKPLLLNKVAVVPNPRISDAAMLSAMFAAEAGRADFATYLDAAFRGPTMSMMKLMQHLHDLAALHGADCEGHYPHGARAGHDQTYGAPGNQAELGRHRRRAGFAGPDVQLQQVHDLALGSGAKCAVYRQMLDGALGKTVEYEPGKHYQQMVNMLPAYRDYQPGRHLTTANLSLDGDGTALDYSGAALLENLGQAVAVFSEEGRRVAEDYAASRNAEIAKNPHGGPPRLPDTKGWRDWD